jgi:hypothetical protein
MLKNARREMRQIECPEEKRTANVYLEWEDSWDKPMLNGICCDNPRLRDIDNWECEWSCWEQITGEEES